MQSSGGGRVFPHVTILLSFVCAIALTHLLSTTTELVLARKRVRFSGLYAAWMFNTVLLLLNNCSWRIADPVALRVTTDSSGWKGPLLAPRSPPRG